MLWCPTCSTPRRVSRDHRAAGRPFTPVAPWSGLSPVSSPRPPLPESREKSAGWCRCCVHVTISVFTHDTARPSGCGGGDARGYRRVEELRKPARTLATCVRVNPPHASYPTPRLRPQRAARSARACCFPPNHLRAESWTAHGHNGCADRPWDATARTRGPVRGSHEVVPPRVFPRHPHGKGRGARRCGRCVRRCGSEVAGVRTGQRGFRGAGTGRRTLMIVVSVASAFPRGGPTWCSA